MGQDAAEHPHGGGLAGAVRPQEGKDLTPEYFQVEVVHRHPGPEPFGQPRGLQANFRIII